MNQKQREKFAKSMASFLFMNVTGKKAYLLKGISSNGEYIGGWCEESVANQILKRLTAAERAARKKGKKK